MRIKKNIFNFGIFIFLTSFCCSSCSSCNNEERHSLKKQKNHQIISDKDSFGTRVQKPRIFSSEEKKAIEQHAIGLQNVGNSCYMNSALQCLFHMQYFLDTCKNKEGLSSVLSNFINEYQSTKQPSFNPESYINGIKSFLPEFNDKQQHSASEFLELIIDKTQDDKSVYFLQENDDPPYFLIFTKNELTLQSLSLQSLFKERYETYWKQHQNSESTLFKTNKILIIEIYAECDGKILSIPIKNLDLTPYGVTCPDGKEPIYNLYAVSYHHGKSLKSGHYTSSIKIGEQWYNFNDSTVRPIKETEVENVIKGTEVIKPSILFYIRQDIDK